jgi:hypothetical protein
VTVPAEHDLLRARLGSGRESHAEEYEQILADLADAGVEIDYRNGQLAYSPARGGPGRLILDPEASIAALRHEYRHFCDIRDAGYRGLSYYLMNVNEFAKLEVRGYLEEIRTAREFADKRLEAAILEQMKQRVRELLGD